MLRKRALFTILLAAALLLAACTGKPPAPSEPELPFIEPVEAAAVEALPQDSGWTYAAVKTGEIFPAPFSLLDANAPQNCWPQMSQTGEVQFALSVPEAEQRACWEEALRRFGGLSDLPQTLYNLEIPHEKVPLRVSCLRLGGADILMQGTPAGDLSVIVLASADQAPAPLSDWLRKTEPDANTLHTARRLHRVHTATGKVVEEESFTYLRVEKREGLLVLTQCTTAFTPVLVPAGDEVENAFGVKVFSQTFARQTFESVLPKI